MEEKWTKMLPIIIFYGIMMYLLSGLLFGFYPEWKSCIFLAIVYYLTLSGYLDPAQMEINEQYIRTITIFRKVECIQIADIKKIRLENRSSRIVKNYMLYVHTIDRIYKFSAHLFKTKALNTYLSTLCKERGIEYYFKK